MSATVHTMLAMISETKVCGECGVEKPAADFYVTRDKRDGKEYLSARCKPCTYERLKAWREQNPDRVAEQNKSAWRKISMDTALMARKSAHERKYLLKARYGITVEQYNEMLERQGGVCAICRSPESMTMKGTIANLAVDHDPETGRVRGLLCFDCNTGIGKLNHDPALLVAALDYLED